jgi:hypothetical protein
VVGRPARRRLGARIPGLDRGLADRAQRPHGAAPLGQAVDAGQIDTEFDRAAIVQRSNGASHKADQLLHPSEVFQPRLGYVVSGACYAIAHGLKLGSRLGRIVPDCCPKLHRAPVLPSSCKCAKSCALIW